MRRLLPLIILVLISLLIWGMGGGKYFTFENFEQHRQMISNFVASHFILAMFVFSCLYILVVALSIPGATLMTLVGGFLFGVMMGSVCIVISATIGSVLIFLIARYAAADFFTQKSGPWLQHFKQGFERDGVAYLLILRLIPLFPFWLVNIVPALLNMRLLPYTIATFFGIIPGAVIYVSLGSSLGTVLDQGQAPNLSIIFEPRILAPLVGLAALILMSTWMRRIYKK